jgi:hypothetical protein
MTFFSDLLTAIDIVTGITRWANFDNIDRYSHISVGHDNSVYIIGFDDDGDKAVGRVNGETGVIIDDTGVDDCFAFAIGEEAQVLYVATLRTIVAIDISDFSDIWLYNTVDDITSLPVVGPDGVLYVGTIRDSVIALNSEGSLLWASEKRTYNDIYSKRTLAVNSMLIYSGYIGGLSAYETGYVELIATQNAYEIEVEPHEGSMLSAAYDTILTKIPLVIDDSYMVQIPFQFPFFNNSFDFVHIKSSGLLVLASACDPAFDDCSDSDGNNADKMMSTAAASSSSTLRGTAKYSATKPSRKRSKNLSKKQTLVSSDDEWPISDQYMVVLNRDCTAEHVNALVSDIRSRHELVQLNAAGATASASFFSAEVVRIFPFLRMLAVRNPSEAAVLYIRNHELVQRIDVEAILRLDPRESLRAFSRATPGSAPAPAPIDATGGVHVLSASTYSWGLDRIDQAQTPLDGAAYTPHASTSGGQGVHVYVIDTGIDTNHIEFANTNEREVMNIFNGYGDGAVSDDLDDNGHGM